MSRFEAPRVAEVIVISDSSEEEAEEEAPHAGVGAATAAWMAAHPPVDVSVYWNDMVMMLDRDPALHRTESFRVMQSYSDEVAHWVRPARARHHHDWWYAMWMNSVYNEDAKAAFGHAFPAAVVDTMNPVTAMKRQDTEFYSMHIANAPRARTLVTTVADVPNPPVFSEHSLRRMREAMNIRASFFADACDHYERRARKRILTERTRAKVEETIANGDRRFDMRILRSLTDGDIAEAADMAMFPNATPERVMESAYRYKA